MFYIFLHIKNLIIDKTFLTLLDRLTSLLSPQFVNFVLVKPNLKLIEVFNHID